jgi:hypothetical protein
METLGYISALMAGIFFIYIYYKAVKNNPDLLSAKNIGKSFTTMGLLALFLMAVIYLAYLSME